MSESQRNVFLKVGRCILHITWKDKQVKIAFFFAFFFLLFRAAPAAYGSPQAKGQIGAAAASLHTASATLDP